MEKISVSTLRDIDKALYEKLVKIVEMKGLTFKSKAAMLEYILNDYANQMEIGFMDNPYLMTKIESIINSATQQTEQRLGNRYAKLMGELAIQTAITNRLIAEYFAKFDDPADALKILDDFRHQAVEDLQQRKKPLSYADFIKED